MDHITVEWWNRGAKDLRNKIPTGMRFWKLNSLRVELPLRRSTIRHQVKRSTRHFSLVQSPHLMPRLLREGCSSLMQDQTYNSESQEERQRSGGARNLRKRHEALWRKEERNVVGNTTFKITMGLFTRCPIQNVFGHFPCVNSPPI